MQDPEGNRVKRLGSQRASPTPASPGASYITGASLAVDGGYGA